MATIERHVTNALVALDALTPCREAAKVMRDKKIGSVAGRDDDAHLLCAIRRVVDDVGDDTGGDLSVCEDAVIQPAGERHERRDDPDGARPRE